LKILSKTITVVHVIIACVFFISCSLSQATYKGNFSEVKRLVENGSDINDYDRWGWTPLMWASFYNFYDITKYLLEKGANPNMQAKRSYSSMYKGSTALMMAAYNRNTYMARLLLQRGADPKLSDKVGNNAYTYAERYCPELFEVLNMK